MALKINKGLLLLLFIIFPLLMGGGIYIDNLRPSAYTDLHYLPIATGVLFTVLLLKNGKAFSSFPFICVIGLFYIRNIIAPFALQMAHYNSFFDYVDRNSIDSAIILMLFETSVLSIYSQRMTKRFTYNPLKTNNIAGNKRYYSFVFFMVLISMGMIVLNPSFLGDYVNIFSSEEIRDAQIGDNASGPLFTLFTVIFPIAYLSFSLYLMSLSTRKGTKSTPLVLLAIFIPFMFMNNSDAFTLITVFCLGLTALRFGGMSRKTFGLVMGFGMMAITLYMFSLVANATFNAEEKSVAEKVSNMLQGYLPGVTNFSGIFTMGEHNKLLSLFFDLYATIPFRQTLFGIQGDFKLVDFYTQDSGAYSQVLPCCAQLYYYLGVIGVFVECLFVRFAHLSYYKASKENNLFMYYSRILLFAYLILTPTVYNVTLFLTRFFVTLLPLIIVYKLLKGKVSSQGRKPIIINY